MTEEKAIRVLILSARRLASAFTGDGTQMRHTLREVRPLVDQVTHVYVDPDGRLYDEENQPIRDTLRSLCRRHDVIHQLTRLDYRTHRMIQAELAATPVLISTVYWYNGARVLNAWRNGGRPFRRALAAMRAWRAGWRCLQDYRVGCDVILPNSHAEGRNVIEHFRLASHVVSMPVPNAIEEPGFDLDALSRPADIPFGDYVVCPGVFVERKNQLGLIRALTSSGIPVVFMGNPPPSATSYWEACKRSAGANMVFIGHRDNRSVEYWSVLKHARCACLPSDCETPGIALLEAALAGARPVVTMHGGTPEYFGFSADYLAPCRDDSIREAVMRAWRRGPLSAEERRSFKRFTWRWTGELTVAAYREAIRVHGMRKTRCEA